ncbi:hypothetical protein [Halobacillus salinus]|uniref:hypothetical protein n=1 Tax=Halobacillus salinus TaxID=192814 RepID=UPI0009A660DA|nr:hypothetical protein [Halobacillus salinus]
MFSTHSKGKLGLALAFFGLFLAPIGLAGMAIGALLSPAAAPFVTNVLISVLVLAVVYLIVFFVFLKRFLKCVCHKG